MKVEKLRKELEKFAHWYSTNPIPVTNYMKEEPMESVDNYMKSIEKPMPEMKNIDEIFEQFKTDIKNLF